MDTKIAKAGTLLLLDEGEYSDYQVIGFFVVLNDFNPTDELNEFFKLNPKMKKSLSYSGPFIQFLISKGYLLELNYGNLYLGSYGSPDTTYFTP